MPARETFAAELEALVDKYGHSLNDNEVITTLEEALSRAWGFACEPQPASLFAVAPALLGSVRELKELFRFALLNTTAELARDGMVFIREAEAIIAAAEGR